MNLLLLFIIVVIILILILLLSYLSIHHSGLFMRWRHDRSWLPTVGSPFLEEGETSEIEKKIRQLPIRWSNGTLGTIGVASYIDSPDDHRRHATEMNKLLKKEFPGLHQKLLSHLNHRFETMEKEDHGGEEPSRWVYPPKRYGIALPGIHLFSGRSMLGRGWSVASVHVDKQEERCPLPSDEEFDFTRTYSFTIPITLPRGTGLYIIEARENDINKWVPLWWSLRNKTMQKIEYEKGHCYLHHGKYFHCIAPFYAKDGNDHRITVQGHAVYCRSRNEYWVYW